MRRTSDRVLILTQTLVFSKKALSSCDYIFEGQLNELLVNKNDLDLPILHLNARSLYGNLGKFKQPEGLIDHEFSVIGISESWLSDSTLDLVDIPGYNCVLNHRVNKTGGGVGIYLLDELEFKIIWDLNTSHPSCYEAIFAENNIPRGKNIIVGTIYRPPDENVNDLLDSLRKLLSTTSRENKICYVMGDFNLDLLRHEQHAITGESVELMFSH